MEEGSPGVYTTHHRFTKRVRALEDFNHKCVVEQSSSPFSILKQGQTTDSLMKARSKFGSGNFKDEARSGFGARNFGDGDRLVFGPGNISGA
ncbi:hypothetical protein GBA52_003085 [Prunus armeniaca]|nr:hypothetical protein GBA52_003085 [Prunus armeniaca]